MGAGVAHAVVAEQNVADLVGVMVPDGHNRVSGISMLLRPRDVVAAIQTPVSSSSMRRRQIG
jgi:hypothetical protein